jgi:hypothetical protein
MAKTKQTTNPIQGWLALAAPNLKIAPLDGTQQEILIRMLADKETNAERIEEIHQHMLGSGGYFIMCKRLEAMCPDILKRIDKKVLFMCGNFIQGNPGRAVLWAYTIAALAAKHQGSVTYTLDRWCEDFSRGTPTEEECKKVWDYQKGGTHKLQGVDNMLDDPFFWPKLSAAPVAETKTETTDEGGSNEPAS